MIEKNKDENGEPTASNQTTEMELTARRVTQLVYPAMQQAGDVPDSGCRVWMVELPEFIPPVLLPAEELNSSTTKLDSLQIEEVYQSLSADSPLEQLNMVACIMFEDARKYAAWKLVLENCLEDDATDRKGLSDYQVARALLPQMLQATLSPPGLQVSLSPGEFFNIWVEKCMQPALMESGEDAMTKQRIWATVASWACTDLIMDFEISEGVNTFVVRLVQTSNILGRAILHVCEQMVPHSTVAVLNTLDSLRS